MMRNILLRLVLPTLVVAAWLPLCGSSAGGQPPADAPPAASSPDGPEGAIFPDGVQTHLEIAVPSHAWFEGACLPVTTPSHDRTAQVWMQFPAGTNPSVRINFTEYPPEGDFRIFRTTIPGPGPRRYYISAVRYVNQVAVPLTVLHASVPLMHDGVIDQPYVDLLPGSTAKIAFKNGVVAAEGEVEVENEFVTSEEFELTQNESATEINGLRQQLTQSQETISALQDQVADLQARPKLPPQVSSDLPTMSFRFREKELRASFRVNNAGAVHSVSFVGPPVGLTLEASPWPDELDEPPAKAELFLALFNADQEPAVQPVYVLPGSVSVQFRQSVTGPVVDVPFTQLDAPLAKGIAALRPLPRMLLVRGYLRFTLNNGRKRIYGPMGNQIDLRLVDVQ